MKALFRVTIIVCVLALASTFHAQQRATANAAAGEYLISGVVLDAFGGQPLSGVTVLIASVENCQTTTTTKTGADGRFSFKGVTRGKYSLAASRRGYPPQALDEHEGFSTGIAVGPGLDTEHIVFRLCPEASIRGTVTDEQNDPVQNASVQLFATRTTDGRLATRAVGSAQTDDRGYFLFARLSEGKYYLAVSGRPWYATPTMRQGGMRRAEAGGNAPRDAAQIEQEAANLDQVYPLTFYGGALTSAEATPLELHPGERATADILVHALPVVHIHFPSEERSTAADPGAQRERRTQTPGVQLFYTVFDSLINAPTMGASGPDGFEVSGFAPGHYVIEVARRGEGGMSSSYVEADLTGDVEAPASFSPTATVSGVVQFDGVRPPSALFFTLTNSQTSRSYSVRIDDDGGFRFDQPVMPGVYEIVGATAPDWYISSIAASGAKVTGHTLRISGSESVRLSLKISRGLGQVDGVALRDGKPWAGAMILLVQRNEMRATGLSRRDQSDSDGTFTLRSIVPGSYTVLAIENGWELAWSDPKVIARYLVSGKAVQISPGAKVQTTVEVQQR